MGFYLLDGDLVRDAFLSQLAPFSLDLSLHILHVALSNKCPATEVVALEHLFENHLYNSFGQLKKIDTYQVLVDDIVLRD